MIRLIWNASVHIRYFIRRYMPTNIALDAIRTRRGLKWGLPAMLLTLPYLYAASFCLQLIETGAPGWLHLIVLVCIWNAMKFFWIGPISLVLLIRERIREATAARRIEAAPTGSAEQPGQLAGAHA
ncbi:hypothetical protein FEF26_10450 [Nesterenkonia salmonea]|uniref:Sulfate permease n=1 Tax=Nesterenkonia salmonea TaxID=1804987 RepID=A0A5R9BAK4_9MICC|nr:hypothetical protein [Nesterenkonia salmonea]TLP95184.1 hypothetical protein FEF26_10450 [Nesterenkonia salmonea]